MNNVTNINITTPNQYGTLTWLHLSDIHVGQPNEEERKVVLHRFVEDVEDCRKKLDLLPNLIFVTGDLAFSGQGSQYEIVLEFLEHIRQVVKLPRDRLFTVPGNHDVVRRITNRLSIALLEESLLTHGAERDETLIRSFLVGESLTTEPGVERPRWYDVLKIGLIYLTSTVVT
jgi:predicted MPP superfamily phosphohydrolase